MNINLNLFKYFLAVAKNNSYTKAAEELMVSQPSLSYSIKILEEQLGYKLFTRNSNNRIELTSEGKNLLSIVEPSLSMLSEIQSAEIKGEIKIGVLPYYAVAAMPLYLKIFNEFYPELKIKIYSLYPEDLKESLDLMKVDLIIGDEQLKDDNYISQKPFGDDPIIKLFVNTGYFKKFPDMVNLDDLTKSKILVTKLNKYTKKLVELYPTLNYEYVENTPCIINLVKHSDVIGLIPKSSIKDEIDVGLFKELNTTFPIPKGELFISCLKTNYTKNIKAIFDIYMKYDLKDMN